MVRGVYERGENGVEKNITHQTSFFKDRGIINLLFLGESNKSGIYSESREGRGGYRVSSKFSYRLKGNKIRIKANEEVGESFFLSKINNRVLEVRFSGDARVSNSMSLIAKVDGKTIRYMLSKA